MDLRQILIATGLAVTFAECRRLVRQGAIKVNDVRQNDLTTVFTSGMILVIKRGKTKLVSFEVP